MLSCIRLNGLLIVAGIMRLQRASAAIWHRRLGHPGDRKLDQMIKSGIAPREAASHPVASCQTLHLNYITREPSGTVLWLAVKGGARVSIRHGILLRHMVMVAHIVAELGS